MEQDWPEERIAERHDAGQTHVLYAGGGQDGCSTSIVDKEILHRHNMLAGLQDGSVM